MEWYEIKNIESVDSPALLVYPDRAKENIRLLIEMAGSVESLRPHVKTNKMGEACQLLLDAGIRKFKCATIAEAEMLGNLEAPDVILAHQPTGPKIHRLIALTKKFPSTHYCTLIDNIGTATKLSEAFLEAELHLDVYIDLNIGMNRSGIKAEDAFDLYKACTFLKGISIIGLHGYDGHIRDTDFAERKRKSDEGFAKVEQLQNEILLFDGKSMKVVVGGSPSFPTHTDRKDVEFSPGTFIFWDWTYKHIVPDEPFDYAALVITRINSIIDEKTFCCDLGHKAVAAENPLPRVHFLNAPNAVPKAQSEEHLSVTVEDTSRYKVGDVLYGVPVHICPTVALYAEANIVENQEVHKQWRVVARDRKISI
jgi:D-serine deaminase-like pyridoxal phosphate-dependent protein